MVLRRRRRRPRWMSPDSCEYHFPGFDETQFQGGATDTTGGLGKVELNLWLELEDTIGWTDADLLIPK